MDYREKEKIAKKCVFRILDARRSGNTRYYYDGVDSTKSALLEVMRENDVYEGLTDELLELVLEMLDYFAVPGYEEKARALIFEYYRWLNDTFTKNFTHMLQILSINR